MLFISPSILKCYLFHPRQILGKSSKYFPKINTFWLVTRIDFWKTHPILFGIAINRLWKMHSYNDGPYLVSFLDEFSRNRFLLQAEIF